MNNSRREVKFVKEVFNRMSTEEEKKKKKRKWKKGVGQTLSDLEKEKRRWWINERRRRRNQNPRSNRLPVLEVNKSKSNQNSGQDTSTLSKLMGRRTPEP